MRIFLYLVLAVSCFTSPILAQDEASDVHQATTPPSGARFEIVQSELAAKWTFRLDRFTGSVSQLVGTKAGAYTWEDMEVAGRAVASPPTHARYQLFTSGLAAKFTFMIDADTGRTWQLTTTTETLADGTTEDDNWWKPLAE